MIVHFGPFQFPALGNYDLSEDSLYAFKYDAANNEWTVEMLSKVVNFCVSHLINMSPQDNK